MLVGFQATDVVSRARFDPVFFIVVVAAGAGYLWARRRAAAKREPWATGHTVAFAWGLVVIVVATMSGLAASSATNATVHMAVDALLVMVAPILLGLGAPIRLALLAAQPRATARILAVLRSRALRRVTHPFTAWVLLGGALVAYYFTGLFAATVQHRAVADVVDLGLLALGCVFVWPAAGIDPLPRPASYPLRIVPLLFALPYFSLLGMALESEQSPLAPGTTVGQLHAGAGLLWTTGELIGVAASILVLIAWVGREERAARRRDDVDDGSAAAQLALWRANREAVAMEEALARSRVVEARPGPAGDG